jgi:hypothetical protein
MTQYQNVGNTNSNLSRSSFQSQAPNSGRGPSGRVVNPYLTPTPDRSQTKPTPSTSYPQHNAVGGNPYNTPMTLRMAPPPRESSTNSIRPNSGSAANNGLLHGLTLASVKNHYLGCLKNVRLANFMTKCRLCGGLIKEYEHYIED